MRFVVAGGGVAGLAAALAVARAGHEAVVLERDVVESQDPPAGGVRRRPARHPALLPAARLPAAGRRVLARARARRARLAQEAGAEPQDLAAELRGPCEPGDEDLVYLWVRRPVIEWALRRRRRPSRLSSSRRRRGSPGCCSTEGRRARGRRDRGTARRSAATSSSTRSAATALRADWPRRPASRPIRGAIYYCRYFELRRRRRAPRPGPPLNPRGDLGYMGFNTFRGDNRTFAVILLVPARDRELRALRDERAWMAACAAITPLDTMTSPGTGGRSPTSCRWAA